MMEAVGVSATGSSVSAVRAAATATNAQASSSASSSGASESKPLSPSTHSDPTTGILVTEYFSSSGDITMQIPSQATLAYMRSGLSESSKAAEQTGAVSTMTTEESAVVA